MFRGRNTIGPLSSSGMPELPLHHKGSDPSTPVSIVERWETFFESARSQDASHPLKDKALLGQIRRRRERSRLHALTTCRFLKILPAHRLWRVCSSPMATLSLYSLI